MISHLLFKLRASRKIIDHLKRICAKFNTAKGAILVKRTHDLTSETNSYQFYITHVPIDWLDNRHTVFANVFKDNKFLMLWLKEM